MKASCIKAYMPYLATQVIRWTSVHLIMSLADSQGKEIVCLVVQNSSCLPERGFRQRWVALRSNEEASISEANKKGHYNRAMGSSNLFSWNMHARACLHPTSRASGHLLILITGLFAFPPFLLLFNRLPAGFTLRPYCWINRACACLKSLFFSPYLFFVLSFCCVLAPCTLHLLAQSVATIAEGPSWLGMVRPAVPSGGHCVGWRAFPSSGGFKHIALTHVSSCCVCVARVRL